MKYNPEKIEKKWQKIWAKNNYAAWATADSGTKKKMYVLDMFPYPSGEGLHVGHLLGYTGTDILARYYRMRGFNVLHPMGWDAFGLPAENYAIKVKKNPMTFVPKNIASFKSQFQRIGLSYDWQREVNTTDPAYYKWTQWFFLKMYELGLAYEAEAPINFCPSCKTGLAREEVIRGRCDRCSSETEVRYLKQWHLRITAYADRLIDDLSDLDWPESIKESQRNWIGRSEGFELDFLSEDKNNKIKVFTTRLDTIYGVSFLALAPEHSLALKLAKGDYFNIVERYLEQTLRKSERERQEEKDISGVFTGSYVIHPLSQRRIPIWVSEYVLAHYGTGAIMGVPAHDRRDYYFAQKFSLPIEEVIEPVPGYPVPYENYGKLKNSEGFSNLTSEEAIEKIGQILTEKGAANQVIYYKLRDWIFSRQRYWGEPIPIIKCGRCGNVPIPEKHLPVKLPRIKKYQPTGTGESPLATVDSWTKVKCPGCGGAGSRETHTMPQWAGSCWYYLRYLDPKNNRVFAAPRKLKYWLPVDIYVGGAEHAVLHLLYARFWHKVLFDLKLVPTTEPFQRLINVGTILGPDNEKMSKSRGNVVRPEILIKQYGIDSLRMYEMFMGPFSEAKPWSQAGIKGTYRFLNQVWYLGQKIKGRKLKVKTSKKSGFEFLTKLHLAIKKVSDDIISLKFNTAVSTLMELANAARTRFEQTNLTVDEFSVLLKLLAPFAPHTAQELWQQLGNKTLLDKEPWPEAETKYLQQEEKVIIIQINGKKRLDLVVSQNYTAAQIEKEALKQERIKKWFKDKKVVKTIFASDRILNFVTN